MSNGPKGSGSEVAMLCGFPWKSSCRGALYRLCTSFNTLHKLYSLPKEDFLPYSQIITGYGIENPMRLCWWVAWLLLFGNRVDRAYWLQLAQRSYSCDRSNFPEEPHRETYKAGACRYRRVNRWQSNCVPSTSHWSISGTWYHPHRWVYWCSCFGSLIFCLIFLAILAIHLFFFCIVLSGTRYGTIHPCGLWRRSWQCLRGPQTSAMCLASPLLRYLWAKLCLLRAILEYRGQAEGWCLSWYDSLLSTLPSTLLLFTVSSHCCHFHLFKRTKLSS